jgi:hypothetical protein
VGLRAASALALFLLTLALPVRGQGVSEERVRDAIDDAVDGLGQALGGGSALTGPAAPTGGLGVFRLNAALGLSEAEIEDPRRPSGRIDVAVPVGTVNGAVGVTGAIDVLGKAGAVAAGDDYESIALELGLGVRVGILPGGLTLPDVSASLWRTWVDGLEYGDPGGDEIGFDADVTTWSARVDAAKSFGVLTPYVGAGFDRTGVEARYRIPAGSSTGGEEIEGSIDASGTQAKAYAGLELNLLVLRAAAEVGRGSSGTFVGVALGF